MNRTAWRNEGRLVVMPIRNKAPLPCDPQGRHGVRGSGSASRPMSHHGKDAATAPRQGVAIERASLPIDRAVHEVLATHGAEAVAEPLGLVACEAREDALNEHLVLQMRVL
eukprot:1953759-Pyramimonas_sp.AAC.2